MSVVKPLPGGPVRQGYLLSQFTSSKNRSFNTVPMRMSSSRCWIISNNFAVYKARPHTHKPGVGQVGRTGSGLWRGFNLPGGRSPAQAWPDSNDHVYPHHQLELFYISTLMCNQENPTRCVFRHEVCLGSETRHVGGLKTEFTGSRRSQTMQRSGIRAR